MNHAITSQEPAPLRVGVVLEDLKPPAWAARVIRDLRASPAVELVAIAEAGRQARPAARWADRVVRALYDGLDAAAVKIASDPFVRTALGELAGVEVLRLRGPLREDDLALLSSRRLDVLLSLLPVPIGARAWACAKYGLWAYEFGGFWEVMDRAGATRSALCARLDERRARVLYESWSGTDTVSVRRGRASCYWKSSAFALRALRELHERGPAVLDEKPVVAHEAPPERRGVASGLARLGRSIVRRETRGLAIRDQWTLGYRIDRTSTPAPAAELTRGVDAVPSRAFSEYQLLSPALDRFWADPFVVPHGDGWALIFEEKLYADRKAHISALHIDRAGRASEPERVLVCDYHLSYPFLFRWQDTWWMIPETARNQTIELWRATEFPRRWVRERTLIDNIAAVDATLFEHAGAWWMYCNLGEPGASREEELHLFHAPSPLGPWTAHRRNPVRSDIRCARPAGRPFFTDGAWHRPAQDGSGGYGSGLVLHRIERLDPHDFAERQIARFAPDWTPGLSGLHTINACPGISLIDVRVARRRR